MIASVQLTLEKLPKVGCQKAFKRLNVRDYPFFDIVILCLLPKGAEHAAALQADATLASPVRSDR